MEAEAEAETADDAAKAGQMIRILDDAITQVQYARREQQQQLSGGSSDSDSDGELGSSSLSLPWAEQRLAVPAVVGVLLFVLVGGIAMWARKRAALLAEQQQQQQQEKQPEYRHSLGAVNIVIGPVGDEEGEVEV